MPWRILAAQSSPVNPSRRSFLGGAALAGGGLLLPATARAASPDLDAESPIAPVTGPAEGYLGDHPEVAHAVLWNLGKEPLAEPTEPAVDVVVIGGGLSGLSTAWLLRDRNPVVLEQGERFGGNARGERWEDIDYSIGSAYFAQAAPGSALYRTFYGPLGLDALWRVSSKEALLFHGAVESGFWDGVTDPAARAQFKAAKKYFLGVWNEGYPDMPPGEDQVLTDEQLAELDRRSFREELERALGGPLHPHMRTALEFYCWSSFGGTLDEISAAAGLNFYTAELAPVCALPGGNSRLAERLLRGLRDAVAPGRLRTRSLVTRVEPRGDHVAVQVLGPDGALSVLAARAVVMACPKFVAARLLPDLPADQVDAIHRLKYRSYLTANVLCARPTRAKFYDMYLLADQPPGPDVAAATDAQGATDVILAQWAAGGHSDRSVLTLYRGFPHDGARAGLLVPASFAHHRDAFATQVQAILPLLGLAAADVQEVRVARFGHALPLAATGLVADGTLALARRTHADRVFFVEQDNWALPAVETCLTSAMQAEPEIRRVLG